MFFTLIKKNLLNILNTFEKTNLVNPTTTNNKLITNTEIFKFI